ncbi:hypothetical protein JR316_0005751 [Psilocybe cubensis]|uniref:Uncharacterized protein n=2 Tax=Psilocybe cubensis TaxID=181762 RepID=A0ACB8H0F9_PSICU|nr:hypothetical protein JR316_0005751 [Psilocybe cubensis]KAH9481230.1 hypothetical protein JR316_0005751 [Psilocybe cubensis]
MLFSSAGALAAATLSFAVSSISAKPVRIPGLLYSRQLDGFDPDQIPSSCLAGSCADYLAAIGQQNCMDLECICTAQVAKTLDACQQCLVDANIPGLTQSDIDQAVKDFVDGCSDAGHPISGVGGGSGSNTSLGGSGSTATSRTSTSTKTATSPTATNPGGGSGPSTGTNPDTDNDNGNGGNTNGPQTNPFNGAVDKTMNIALVTLLWVGLGMVVIA